MKIAKYPIFIVVVVILFCLSTTCLASEQEADYKVLLGEWDVQTEDGQYTFVFVFSIEGDTLRGLFKGTSGDYEMEDLTFEDNKLSFTVDIDAGGQTMSIDYSATIEGDTLEGYLSMEYGEANITGKKRK